MRDLSGDPTRTGGDSVEHQKREAAYFACRFIESGMRVGLGTGSTSEYLVRCLAERLRSGQVRDIVAFPTSKAVRAEAGSLAIPLLEDVDSHSPDLTLDLTIDGADEVDPRLDLIKGAGGAMLREKVAAQAARRVVIIVDERKLSPRLGTQCPVPIEVLPSDQEKQAGFLRSLGAHVTLRTKPDGSIFLTDQDNMVLDAYFGPIADPAGLARHLEEQGEILAHGLFIGLADDVIVGGPKGIRHLRRSASRPT
ncbi:MAG: ribose-5-phosphate isomerase RpiA [Thermoleophilia bacterium]